MVNRRRKLPERNTLRYAARGEIGSANAGWLHWLRKTGGIFTPHIKELTQRMRSLPSGDPQDPDYVRIRYLRYADDWIVGVIGPKHLAETIKDEIR